MANCESKEIIKECVKEKLPLYSVYKAGTSFADRDHMPQRRKWATLLGFSVLFALLVVISVFVILMYSQVKMLTSQNKAVSNTPSTVVNNVAYHIEGTEETVDENIVVTDREEDITTPKARMIFDYENGLVVTKIINERGSEAEDVCFVAKFDSRADIDEVRESVRNEQSEVTVPLNDTEEEYESTDVSVDIDTLSPRAREMCAGHKILMTKKTDGKEPEDYMEDHCDSTIYISSVDQIRLKTVEFGDYKDDWTCKVTISGSFSYKMMIYFKDINMESSVGCNNDYFKMLDGDSINSPDVGYKSRYCGYSPPSQVFTTTGDYLTLYFRSDSSVSNTGFDIVITEYETGLCYSWEHRCSNGRCIDDSLTCNGYNPCGDHSDCDVNVAVIVGPAIGGTAFLVALVVIIILVRRRRYAVARARPGFIGAPVASTITTSQQSASASGSYGLPPGYNTQYGGYSAPVAPYQQMPNANPPPYAPYKQQEMGMPAAN